MRLCLNFLLFGLFLIGCAPRPMTPGPSGDVTFVVPGAGGYGPSYAHLIEGLRAGGVGVADVHTWGSPLFVVNFQDRGVHARAEASLRDRLIAYRYDHPAAQIDLVGHSAGCGVILGALGAEPAPLVRNVILLAPSVSPTYDLAGATRHVEGRVHVFYSDRDTVFLRWRTSTFGTYDNVKAPAAGYGGFVAPSPKLVQHAYDAAWKSLGYDGGHMGCLSGEFARVVVAKLLVGDGEPRPPGGR